MINLLRKMFFWFVGKCLSWLQYFLIGEELRYFSLNPPVYAETTRDGSVHRAFKMWVQMDPNERGPLRQLGPLGSGYYVHPDRDNAEKCTYICRRGAMLKKIWAPGANWGAFFLNIHLHTQIWLVQRMVLRSEVLWWSLEGPDHFHFISTLSSNSSTCFSMLTSGSKCCGKLFTMEPTLIKWGNFFSSHQGRTRVREVLWWHFHISNLSSTL